MSLTPHERQVLAHLLEMAAERYGNHTCNDYEMNNTDENWALLRASYEPPAGDGYEEDRPPPGEKLYAQDFVLMSYFAAKIRGGAK